MDLDYVLRGLTIVLLVGRYVYWRFTEIQADDKKPKTKLPTFKENSKRLSTNILGILVIVQLLQVQIISFEVSDNIRLLGFLLVGIGVIFSILARKELGLNWAHAAEYQIKKSHHLITSGIYTSVRHPIYTGFFLSYIGAELVVGSYLFIVFLVIMPVVGYIQAKKKEEILLNHFGKEYSKYRKKSKMFLPYIW